MRFLKILTVSVASLLMSGCGGPEEVWIYTSLYKHVVAEMTPALEAAVPGVKIQWFQGGSEIIAAKVHAELAGGASRADLIITSDPIWYEELKQANRLMPYKSPSAAEVPAHYSDPEHHYECTRIPVMVIAYHSKMITGAEIPTRWSDLVQPKWKDRLSMGNPLESGTHFTATALLVEKYGWKFFETFRSLNGMAAGGNSSVITRIETGERPIGIVLLENVLQAITKGSPVRAVYPLDGAIPIPSPIAILKPGKENPSHLEKVKKVYDWFFSAEGQSSIVRGGMYSPLPKMVAPDYARPWKQLAVQTLPWSPDKARTILKDRETIKKKFTEAVWVTPQ